MRLTKNRDLILSILNSDNNDMESDYGYPPFSCSSIHYRLKDCFDYHFLIGGKSVDIVPSIKQIERTLRDLVALGLVNVTKLKTRVYGSLDCDKFINHYELPHQTNRNQLIPQIYKLIDKVSRATGRFSFTGKITSPKTIDATTYDSLVKDLRSLMAKTHPDKLGHNELANEFVMLKKELDFLRSMNK